MNYDQIKNIIFKLDPEEAHTIVEKLSTYISKSPYLLKKIENIYRYEDKILSQHLLGTTFKNPVGVGAGFDKNAKMIEVLDAIGFGFVEFGTVTPKPQEGNAKPRLFRYPKYNSIQNAMGFNNDGLDEVKKRVKELYPYKIPLGANIGKNKTTSQEDAIRDYEELILGFDNICDYFVINISSPNTPGLRDLQNESFIKELFSMATKKSSKPILLKIAPDLNVDEALNLSNQAIKYGASGIIATNTTIDYSLLPNAKNFGGLSGEVLKQKSYKLFKEIGREFYKKTTLISVGGIDSAQEAYKRIKAGASLIEILTPLIFKGPLLVHEINSGLAKLLREDGFNHIREAVGSDFR